MKNIIRNIADGILVVFVFAGIIVAIAGLLIGAILAIGTIITTFGIWLGGFIMLLPLGIGIGIADYIKER